MSRDVRGLGWARSGPGANSGLHASGESAEGPGDPAAHRHAGAGGLTRLACAVGLTDVGLTKPGVIKDGSIEACELFHEFGVLSLTHGGSNGSGLTRSGSGDNPGSFVRTWTDKNCMSR
jgi:hypothetical protein